MRKFFYTFQSEESPSAFSPFTFGFLLTATIFFIVSFLIMLLTKHDGFSGYIIDSFHWFKRYIYVYFIGGVAYKLYYTHFKKGGTL